MTLKTRHRIFFEPAEAMRSLPADSFSLVVTSPPYPMIEMWDAVFERQDPSVGEALGHHDGPAAFERMHRVLDPAWRQVFRVLEAGGIACVNIGDATRSVGGSFRLYANHSRILRYMETIGFSPLPVILWRKPTNAPNKFMGSGMLPAGAYVTLEHETILVLRKGGKREFVKEEEKRRRRESAYFWEERNIWFSDVWTDLTGTRQAMSHSRTRNRSGAFPFELAYRLVNMFSVKGDTVLDPFVGSGTTILAAMAACRNSVGYEIDTTFEEIIDGNMGKIVPMANARIRRRLEGHMRFVSERRDGGNNFKHLNRHYGFPVMTRQETEILLNDLVRVDAVGENTFEATCTNIPQADL